MLTIYYSTDLSLLRDQFVQNLKNDQAQKKSIFQPDTLIVPNRDTGRWIQMEIARQSGISMNLDITLPASFVNRLYRHFKPDYEDQLFSKESLTWILFTFFGEKNWLEKRPQLNRIQNFIHTGDSDVLRDLRRFQVASAIADVFDQYFLFRPDWIDAFNAGKLPNGAPGEFQWQAFLWREIKSAYPQALDRATLHKTMEDAFPFDDNPPDDRILPNRAHIFGVLEAPPVFLSTLFRLAEKRGDKKIQTDLYLPVISINSLKEAPDNSLINRLGVDADEHIRLIKKFAEEFSEDIRYIPLKPENPTKTNLLHFLKDKVKGDDQTELPEKNDSSLTVHSVHNKLRETEVLRDQILEFLQETPDAGPQDVLVLSSDPNAYAPFVKAVFGHPDDESLKIPYSIRDTVDSPSGRIIRHFSETIRTANGRFRASEILGLLDAAPVRENLGLSRDDIALTEKWVKEVHIHWGSDADQRQDDGISSWDNGLSRLIFGWMSGSEVNDALNDIWPWDGLEGASHQQVLGRVVKFVNILNEIRKYSRDEHPLSDWAEKLVEWFDALYEMDFQRERARMQLLDFMHQLTETYEKWKLSSKAGYGVIESWLSGLEESGSAGSSLRSGSVTFSAMVPVRRIPFRFIAVLGLNESDFPGRDQKSGFDIMARSEMHRPGDRSKRKTDRGLFLDAMLAAQDRLMLSYNGFSNKDGKQIPPSVVISEMLEFLSEQGIGFSNEITQTHTLHGFNTLNIEKTYSVKSARLNSILKSKYDNIRKGKSPDSVRFDVPVPLSEETLELRLSDILKTLREPVSSFIRNRLGIMIRDNEENPEDRDQFDLDGLETYSLLKEISENRDHEKIKKQYRLQGRLPYGSAGDRIFDQIKSDYENFQQQIPEELKHPSEETLNGIKLDFDDINGKQISVSAPKYELHDRKIILHSLSKLKPKAVFEHWLKHLANTIEEESDITSVMLCFNRKEGKTDIITFLPVDNAQDLFEEALKRFMMISEHPIKVHYQPVIETMLSKKDDENAELKNLYGFYDGDGYNGPGIDFEDRLFQKHRPDYLDIGENARAETRSFLEPMLNYLKKDEVKK